VPTVSPPLDSLPRRRRAFSCGRRCVRIPHRDRIEKLRHAEVENLDPIVVRNHDVARLQVAVEHPGGVSAREPLGDLRRERQHFRERQRDPASQELAQASAVNELHGHEDQAVGFLTE
jgi:hypothetical protein